MNNSNVHSLFANEPHIWRCDCGNCAFVLYENGGVECSECGEMQVGDVVYTIPRRCTRRIEYNEDE